MDLIRIDVTKHISVGTFINFVWVTIGENFLSVLKLDYYSFDYLITIPVDLSSLPTFFAEI